MTEGLPNLQPLFVTVDPDRDSTAVMKEYLKGESAMIVFSFKFSRLRVPDSFTASLQNSTLSCWG